MLLIGEPYVFRRNCPETQGIKQRQARQPPLLGVFFELVIAFNLLKTVFLEHVFMPENEVLFGLLFWSLKGHCHQNSLLQY